MIKFCIIIIFNKDLLMIVKKKKKELKRIFNRKGKTSNEYQAYFVRHRKLVE